MTLSSVFAWKARNRAWRWLSCPIACGIAPWLIGYVRYADVFGNQFLTGFCYYRGTFNGKWFAQGGPAHNYRRKLTSDELKIADDRDRGNSLFVDVMDA